LVGGNLGAEQVGNRDRRDDQDDRDYDQEFDEGKPALPILPSIRVVIFIQHFPQAPLVSQKRRGEADDFPP
jgi:hypothetical protein